MLTRRTLLLSLPAVAISVQALQAQSTRTGTFTGRSNHVTTGGVTVEGNTINLASDFSLDNGPDPVVGVGKDGKYDPASFSGGLKSGKGASSYTLPAGLDAADYNEVYIWCRVADVPLGIAPLN